MIVMSSEQIKIVENLLNKDTESLSFGELQAIVAMIYDIWRIEKEKVEDWIPVDPDLKDLSLFDEDWVLLAAKMNPEGWYGVPFIGELRNGIWYEHAKGDVPIEETYGVKITHWRPIQNYEVGVYHL